MIIILIFCILNVLGEYLVLSLPLSEILIFFPLISYNHYNTSSFGISYISKSWLIEHLNFGVKGFLSGALAEVNTRVDVILLGLYTNFTIVGIYTFAATFAEGFSQISFV